MHSKNSRVSRGQHHYGRTCLENSKAGIRFVLVKRHKAQGVSQGGTMCPVTIRHMANTATRNHKALNTICYKMPALSPATWAIQ